MEICRRGAARRRPRLGLTDGFGGNSWRLVTTASAKDEVAKCPNITDFEYADGQGNTQKAISDIQGMVAKGIKALVVFPDAGQAVLPTLRSAYQAGVKVVPYRVFPGGTDGTDYNVWVGADFTTDGKNWANWILKNLPNGGNVLFLSGPAGNSQGIDEGKALHSVLDPTGKYNFIGQQPFEPTNWDPALTQQVLDRCDRQVPEDRRHRVRLRPLARRCPASLRQEQPVHPGAGHLRRQRAVVLLGGAEGHQPGLQDVHGRDGQRQRPTRRRLGGGAGHRRQDTGLEGVRGAGVRGLGQRSAARA